MPSVYDLSGSITMHKFEQEFSNKPLSHDLNKQYTGADLLVLGDHDYKKTSQAAECLKLADAHAAKAVAITSPPTDPSFPKLVQHSAAATLLTWFYRTSVFVMRNYYRLSRVPVLPLTPYRQGLYFRWTVNQLLFDVLASTAELGNLLAASTDSINDQSSVRVARALSINLCVRKWTSEIARYKRAFEEWTTFFPNDPLVFLQAPPVPYKSVPLNGFLSLTPGEIVELAIRDAKRTYIAILCLIIFSGMSWTTRSNPRIILG